MHYHAEIVVESLEGVEEQIASLMEPHKEDWEAKSGDTGFWDWFQIGGRYTGIHSDYDPTKDPRNIETCGCCEGSGFRRDKVGNDARSKNASYTCNACGDCNEAGQWTHGEYGPGRKLKWPTQWASFAGDIVPVAEVSADLTAYTLIVGDKALHIQEWDGKEFQPGALKGRKIKEVLAELGVTDGFLVTVDYHC